MSVGGSFIQLWSDKKRKSADQIIDYLIDTKGRDGWKIDGKFTFALQELSASSKDQCLSDSVVLKVLSEMKVLSRNGVDDFELTYKELQKSKKIDSEIKLQQWRFYLPVKFEISDEITLPIKLSVLGIQFHIVSRKSVDKALPSNLLNTPHKLRHTLGLSGNDCDMIPSSFIKITGKGNNWRDVWDRLSSSFDVFRGLLEFTYSCGHWRHSSIPSPRGIVPHPQWILAVDENDLVDGTSFLLEKHDYKPLKIDPDGLSVFKRNAKRFKSEMESVSTMTVIADSLRLYSQAMDARFPHHCFQGLWQMAEAITLSENFSGHTDEVCKRLEWHSNQYDLVGSRFSDTLRAFAKKRNEIVHRGIHNVSEEDVNILKMIIEFGFKWLWENAKNLPTKHHLENYYNLRTLGPINLNALKESSVFILQERL